jgi:hypothetical protein
MPEQDISILRVRWSVGQVATFWFGCEGWFVASVTIWQGCEARATPFQDSGRATEAEQDPLAERREYAAEVDPACWKVRRAL